MTQKQVTDAAARSGIEAPGPDASSSPAITVRPLSAAEEYAACVELQRSTWGQDYADCVPTSLLRLAKRTGGVAGGAFTESGELIGFVYGITGVRQGAPFHWSHMLAVAPAYRNRGVGARLKAFQRASLRGSGIDVIHWTFDPLVARNAHLNLNKLGARVIEYVPDMYGDTGSELHAYGTDRFVVTWSVAAELHRPGRIPPAWRTAPIAGTPPANGSVVRIEIPPDVDQLPVEQARAWRAATRASFVDHLLRGYEVTAYYAAGGRAFYVLTASS